MADKKSRPINSSDIYYSENQIIYSLRFDIDMGIACVKPCSNMTGEAKKKCFAEFNWNVWLAFT